MILTMQRDRAASVACMATEDTVKLPCSVAHTCQSHTLMVDARCWPAGDSPAPFMPNLSFKSYSKDGSEAQGDSAQPIQPQPEEPAKQTNNGWAGVLGLSCWSCGCAVSVQQLSGLDVNILGPT